MKEVKRKTLVHLLNKIKKKKVAVIGDIMVDRYIKGRVSRISPEAPVPVVEVTDEYVRIGGAGNVANNIYTLGGTPLLFGIIGADEAGRNLVKIMQEKNLETAGILTDKSRPTTLKTRIIAQNQHVVRADFESKECISQEIDDKLLDLLEKNIGTIDGIILEDYNKGVLSKSIISRVIELAGKHNCPVTVDPKFNNFFEYRNVTLFKPNIGETRSALGFSLDSEERISVAGRLLLERLNCENVLITRGSQGMSLFSKDGFEGRIKTKAKKIADVSGAGDAVISTITLILAAAGDIQDAAIIANHAAGVVVGEVGIVPIEPEKILESFDNDE